MSKSDWPQIVSNITKSIDPLGRAFANTCIDNAYQINSLDMKDINRANNDFYAITRAFQALHIIKYIHAKQYISKTDGLEFSTALMAEAFKDTYDKSSTTFLTYQPLFDNNVAMITTFLTDLLETYRYKECPIDDAMNIFDQVPYHLFVMFNYFIVAEGFNDKKEADYIANEMKKQYQESLINHFNKVVN